MEVRKAWLVMIDYFYCYSSKKVRTFVKNQLYWILCG